MPLKGWPIAAPAGIVLVVLTIIVGRFIDEHRAHETELFSALFVGVLFAVRFAAGLVGQRFTIVNLDTGEKEEWPPADAADRES